MVWNEKSKAILMLNKLMEKGCFKKCEQYWPPHYGDPFICKDVQIQVDNIQSESYIDYILTNLRLTNLASNEERIVLHFQFIRWPILGVPRCPDDFLNFLQAVRETGSLEEDVGPPVVHCSAGIGRSGIFCLVDTSLVLIDKEGPSSVILKKFC
ncbi:PTPN1 [Lepeophtheirus salmonis]|uniref:protein-tyrosine-phosphatase n=1 Tax=Lepeophtheirus salmonis TaxID=72036 RepID=A0A7R8CQW5_LEPSM|nr:PTPN1 [Lepeophtheirus salmonis]CAF2862260.1 PTPN1 [Lepeophtheirus salmonis]